MCRWRRPEFLPSTPNESARDFEDDALGYGAVGDGTVENAGETAAGRAQARRRFHGAPCFTREKEIQRLERMIRRRRGREQRLDGRGRDANARRRFSRPRRLLASCWGNGGQSGGTEIEFEQST